MEKILREYNNIKEEIRTLKDVIAESVDIKAGNSFSTHRKVKSSSSYVENALITNEKLKDKIDRLEYVIYHVDIMIECLEHDEKAVINHTYKRKATQSFISSYLNVSTGKVNSLRKKAIHKLERLAQFNICNFYDCLGWGDPLMGQNTPRND